MSAHDWTLEAVLDSVEIHFCRSCGVFRRSEPGAPTEFQRQLPREEGARPRYQKLGTGEPACG